MKVAHILPYLPPKIGGRELWIRWMTPELLKRGVDVTIFAANVQDYHRYRRRFQKKIWKYEGIDKSARVYLANTLYNNDKYSTPLIIPPFLKLWKEDPDIVHLHEPNIFVTTMLGGFAKLFMRKKVILHCHSDAFKWKGLAWYLRPVMTAYGWLYWLKLRFSDLVLGVSREYIMNSPYLRRFRRKTRVFPMSLAPAFRPLGAKQRRDFRKSKGIPKDRKIVLYVGRIDPRKGINYLVDAVSAIPDTELLVVGSGDENSTRELKRQVKERGMRRRTRFVPTVMQEELNAYYNIADVLGLPTNDLTETFGVVLLEAWAVKLPVVVTDIPAPKNLVGRSGGGLVAKRMDPDDIRKKILRIIRNPSDAERMGKKGHEFVKQFSFPSLSKRLAGIYEGLMEGETGKQTEKKHKSDDRRDRKGQTRKNRRQKKIVQ
ncbi:MAG: glycosyltransferase [Candidatus Woesearchaeota archaeon]